MSPKFATLTAFFILVIFSTPNVRAQTPDMLSKPVTTNRPVALIDDVTSQRTAELIAPNYQPERRAKWAKFVSEDAVQHASRQPMPAPVTQKLPSKFSKNQQPTRLSDARTVKMPVDSLASNRLAESIAENLSGTGCSKQQMEQVMVAAFAVVAERVRQENEFIVAQLKKRHAMEMAELRSTLKSNQDFTNELNHMFRTLYANQNRNLRELQVMANSSRATNQILARFEQKIESDESEATCPHPDCEICSAAKQPPTTVWTPFTEGFPRPITYQGRSAIGVDQINPQEMHYYGNSIKPALDEEGNHIYATTRGAYILPPNQSRMPASGNVQAGYEEANTSFYDQQIEQMRLQMKILEQRIEQFQARRMLSPVYPPENVLAPIDAAPRQTPEHEPSPYRR